MNPQTYVMLLLSTHLFKSKRLVEFAHYWALPRFYRADLINVFLGTKYHKSE